MTEDMKSFPARFPAPLHEQLRQAAHDRHLSMNQIVISAVEKELSTRKEES